ncbi:hypothetical protein VV867_30730 [Pseudomonas sp. JH-2]|uniref:hypothetical protein n=1 Tax=Pseudomonas sp. JH-2 TaxID=3114998 RepID=UPI002E2770D8|nr:hypothetical protein [Pseudomonas sp. JH-2]
MPHLPPMTTGHGGLRLRSGSVLVLLLVLLAGLAPSSQGQSGQRTAKGEVESFVRRLYGDEGPGAFSADSGEARARRWLSPALAQALAAYRSARHAGPGLLEKDPLCLCRRSRALELEQLDVSLAGDGRATARVVLVHEQWRRGVRLHLVRRGKAWRLDDLAQPALPSLRRALERATRGTPASGGPPADGGRGSGNEKRLP